MHNQLKEDDFMPKYRNPHIQSRKGLKIRFDAFKLTLAKELEQMGYNSSVVGVIHVKDKSGVDVYTINLYKPYARIEKITLAFAKYQSDKIQIRYKCKYTHEEYQDFWMRYGKTIFELEAERNKRQSLRLWCR